MGRVHDRLAYNTVGADNPYGEVYESTYSTDSFAAQQELYSVLSTNDPSIVILWSFHV